MPQGKPQDAEKDNFDDDVVPEVAAKAVAPAQSRFPSRLVKDAEAIGISPDHIEECGSATDLFVLIQNERSKISESRREQAGRVTPAKEALPATVPAPPVTPAEEEYKFDEDFERDVDPSIKKEVLKIRKLIAEAKRDGDKSEVAELKKKLDETNATIERMNARNHPLQKRANTHVLKYPALFGTELDDDGIPTEAKSRYRFQKMVDFTFNERDAEGKNRATGNPEKDIDTAVAFLFPGHELAAETPAPPPKTKSANGSRIAQWAESGQAATTARNGADRSGVPGGTKGAVKKVAEVMKKHGVDPGDTDDDDDNEV